MSDSYFDDLLERFSEREGTGLSQPCPVHVPAQGRMVEALGHAGHEGQLQTQGKEAVSPSLPQANLSSAPAGAEADIGLLLNNLRFDFTGAPLHDIDDELASMIRLAMLPMGKRPRAELAALIDDHLAQPEGLERVQALLEECIEAQAPTWRW